MSIEPGYLCPGFFYALFIRKIVAYKMNATRSIVMVSFSHMIFYVKDVEAALAFYNEAFDVETLFIHESRAYGELKTGSTALAFASEELGKMNLPEGFRGNDLKDVPAGCEVVFTTEDIEKTYEKAISKGAVDVAKPMQKPWGQKVAYVRDLDGLLIEIATVMK